jgi:type VI secretion system protein ImpJ
MKQLEPVIWTKGTLLNPQHLQMQDRFLESNLEFHLNSLAFCPWGFRSLRMDQEALAAGMVALSAASGIFPDGLLFEIPLADAGPAARPLSGAFEPDQESLEVFLAVPQYRDLGINISASGRDADARYRAEYAMVRDENTGLSEKPVQIARKNMRILFEGEAQEGNSVLQLARIQRTPAGLFQLDPRHVPPLLDLAASDYLVAIARRLRAPAASRARAAKRTRALPTSPPPTLRIFGCCIQSTRTFRYSGICSKPAAAIPNGFFPPCLPWPVA